MIPDWSILTILISDWSILTILVSDWLVYRFYLGYPAVGLLKFSTLGFFFIGHLVDIVLIATQTLGPADGSHYVISYYGAGKLALASTS